MLFGKLLPISKTPVEGACYIFVGLDRALWEEDREVLSSLKNGVCLGRRTPVTPVTSGLLGAWPGTWECRDLIARWIQKISS